MEETDGQKEKKKAWQSSCLWKRKTTLSHFLPFCLKLATGVAYLNRTEILEEERQGVSAITSFSPHFLKVDKWEKVITTVWQVCRFESFFFFFNFTAGAHLKSKGGIAFFY